jgi:hypothetical protein
LPSAVGGVGEEGAGLRNKASSLEFSAVNRLFSRSICSIFLDQWNFFVDPLAVAPQTQDLDYALSRTLFALANGSANSASTRTNVTEAAMKPMAHCSGSWTV